MSKSGLVTLLTYCTPWWPRTPSRPRPNVSTTSEPCAPLGVHLPGVTSLLYLQSRSLMMSCRTRDPESQTPIIENVTVLTTDLLQASRTCVAERQSVVARICIGKIAPTDCSPGRRLRGRGSLRRWEAGTCSERVGGCRRTVCSKKGR